MGMLKHGVIAIVSRINHQAKEYLFIKAATDNDNYTDKYYPPGGGIKDGETESDAIIRELNEELNLPVKPVKKIIDLPADVPDTLLHFWECEIPTDKISQVKINQKELADAQWFTRDKILSIPLYPATRKLFQEFILE